MISNDSPIKQDDKNLTLTPKIYHRHDFEKKENYLVCSICGKKKLYLEISETEGIFKGKRDNGRDYSVRNSRKRYFFPDEWKLFLSKITNYKHWFFFLTLLHTGARTMEVLNLRYKNYDLERGTITFEVVKHRSAKKNIYAIGKVRTFFVSSNYLKEARKYIKNKNPEEYLFLDNKKLPSNYSDLSNKEKKKYYSKTQIAYSQLFKKKLQKTNIKDWKNFSLHNIRKTYGNYMRIYDLKTEEICYRLGHDFNTYLAHYGSPMIFTDQERREIMNIFGEVK